jgi:predicted permease
LKLGESWRLAGIISQEVRFKAFLEANPSNLARVKEEPTRIARAIRSQSRMSAFFSSMILVMLSILAIASSAFDTEIGRADARLAVGFTIYLTLSFVVVFFLNLTTTTGLFTSGAMRLPSTLPLSRADLEHLNFMTFVRVFIWPVLLSLIIFPTGCLIVFGPIVALVAVIACACTVSVAIGALIRVSKWFHKKTHQTDESRLSSIVRVAASLGIVIGMISIYSLGSYLPALMSFIIDLATTAGPGVFTILALIFPFSYGFLASSAAFGALVPLDTFLASIAGAAFYSILAVVAYRSSGQSLRAVTLGGISTSKPTLLREVAVDTTTPLRSMVRKDLKLATRNIGSAFIFAIPIFLLIMIFPMRQYWRDAGGFLRSMSALTAVEYANLFGGLSLVSVLLFDTQGASIHEGLPISSKLVLKTKTVIMIVPYIFSMIALDIVIFLNSPISPMILLMPIIQIPCGYVVGMAVGGTVFKMRGGGRAVAVNVTSDQAMGLIAGAVGALTGIIPLVGYGLAMIATGSYLISLTSQGVLVVTSVIAASKLIPRLLKD